MPERDTKNWLQRTSRVIYDTANVGEGEAVRSAVFEMGLNSRLDLQQATRNLSGEGMFMTLFGHIGDKNKEHELVN